MNSLFVITAATNTRFGIHSRNERLKQTLDTIISIKKAAPDAKILLVEMGGEALTYQQIEIYQEESDYMMDFSNTPQVRSIYDITNSWDIVKNITEVMIFGEVLQTLLNNKLTDEFERIFKISGRYQLTERFNIGFHLTETESIVISRARASQFSRQVTGGLSKQYMSRLWSWPSKASPRIREAYKNGLDAMVQRVNEGGYFDIEHMLYRYLPSDLIIEVEKIGVCGNLGPNGVYVED